MAEQPLFFLISVNEDVLMDHWTIRAADELAVMRHVLDNIWMYEGLFWALQINLFKIDQVSPEDLLQAIKDSYGARLNATIYLIRVAPTEIHAGNPDNERTTA
jgi:hypothetical protein